VTADVLFVGVPAVDHRLRLERLGVASFGDLVSLPERVAEQLDDPVLLVQVPQRGLVGLGVDGRPLGVAFAYLVQVIDRGQDADAVSLDVFHALVDVGLAVGIFVLKEEIDCFELHVKNTFVCK